MLRSIRYKKLKNLRLLRKTKPVESKIAILFASDPYLTMSPIIRSAESIVLLTNNSNRFTERTK